MCRDNLRGNLRRDQLIVLSAKKLGILKEIALNWYISVVQDEGIQFLGIRVVEGIFHQVDISPLILVLLLVEEV